jgi:hypothetical protein
MRTIISALLAGLLALCGIISNEDAYGAGVNNETQHA